MRGTSDSKEEARAQASARRRDLPDLVTFMLGTGVRIGEALGVRWCDVDLAATIWHDSGVLTDRQKADLTGHAKISTLTDIYVASVELHPQGAAVMDAAWLDS
jgi:hypothetical protein